VFQGIGPAADNCFVSTDGCIFTVNLAHSYGKCKRKKGKNIVFEKIVVFASNVSIFIQRLIANIQYCIFPVRLLSPGLSVVSEGLVKGN
jgi:hypothetical protein